MAYSVVFQLLFNLQRNCTCLMKMLPYHEVPFTNGKPQNAGNH